MSNYTIRLEEKKDYRDVENLVRESFWNVYRPGCSEHYVIHMLRDDPAFIPELKRKGYATEAVKLALRWASECIVI